MAPKAKNTVVNFYAVLGVGEDDDEAAIKKAYRVLVLRWHPDKNVEQRTMAEEKIRAINAAYEILSNPVKRETYDLQRHAMKNGGRGAAPAKPRVSARMTMPKEFMLQPLGHPESFVRGIGGRRTGVQTRSEAGHTDFQAFFKAAKFSLWWLPDVNNQCRIRSHGSKGKGDKKSAAAGLAGGLNLSFNVSGTETNGESEVELTVANKGQKNDRVNFVAKESPEFEGAFRFETACRRGSYLAFVPPHSLRIVPLLDEEYSRVMDFMMVDFETMFRYITLEEVLLPVTRAPEAPKAIVKELFKRKHGQAQAAKEEKAKRAKPRPAPVHAAPRGASEAPFWMPLEKLRKEASVKSYFEKVLQQPLWELDDFAAFIKGHWAIWEYDEEKTAVRVRPPEEQLARALMEASDGRRVAYKLVEAGEELDRIPIGAAAKALRLLADEQDSDDAAVVDEESNRVGDETSAAKRPRKEDHGSGEVKESELAEAKADRSLAVRRLFGAMKRIGQGATAAGKEELSVEELVTVAERASRLGGKRPGYDTMMERKEAVRYFADLAFARLAESNATSSTSSSASLAPAALPSPPAVKPELLQRLLRLPGASEHSETLGPLCAEFVVETSGGLAAALRDVAAAGSEELLGVAASRVLARLDLMDADDAASALQAMAEAGADLDAVVAALGTRAPAIGVKASAAALVAVAARISARGATSAVTSEALGAAADSVAGKELAQLPHGLLLDLIVAVAGASSLRPVLEPAVAAAVGRVSGWSAAEIVRMLLALARSRFPLRLDLRELLLRNVADALPLAELSSEDLLKVVLAVSGFGASELLASAGRQVAAHALEQRLTQHQMLLATQALVRGLGAEHDAVAGVLALWPAMLRRETVEDRPPSNEDLSAEHIAKLLACLPSAAVAVGGATEANAARSDVMEAVCAAAATRALELLRKGSISEVGRRLLLAEVAAPALGQPGGGRLAQVTCRKELKAALVKLGAAAVVTGASEKPKKKKRRR